ncbi:FIST C-terminal domain-containing protein [Maribius pontilimi]|uniref:FIST C-terminal domain-containing protein n=2 Tax=Palleronia pontilimi TaxID=1964209 RepID=A0A934IFC1_9RHOB|nr:FIST C-terminal domain-containing protein [Palleronia pontilimi]
MPTADGRAPAHLIRNATVPCDLDDPIGALKDQLGPGPFAQVFFFVSPACDFAALSLRARDAFPGTSTLLASTAGELGPEGYAEATIIAVALPQAHFRCRTLAIAPLDGLDPDGLSGHLVSERMALSTDHPDLPGGFAFLLVDGLSMREDTLLSAILPGLGTLPLFGGSTGDGRRFRKTHLALDGVVLDQAAVLTLVATDCETRVFSLDNLRPADTRMVVTGADPERRLVTHINAAPAAREYARLIGKDPDQLDEFTFAAHPVAVQLGDRHHVRAIQRVNAAGELHFFSAIEEGMVLRVAHADDLPDHLDRALSGLSQDQPPGDILACDCILRRIAAEQSQSVRAVSDVLSRHRVIGFSTYGEQIGPMHVNQTMTGVAIYPPRTRE